MTASASDPRFERRSEAVPDDPSSRGETHRDHDRILYSEAFRRLGGVTQVALGAPGMGLHNRLTHSLKVEQVGVSIYSKLTAEHGPLTAIADEYATAAACLAHDLGHPPFGHAGEQELHSLIVCKDHLLTPRTYKERMANPCDGCKLEDGFEGNAQSFRILTALEVHKDPVSPIPFGLDLTSATLRAASKYPWTRGDLRSKKKKDNKWGAYDCDQELLLKLTGDSQNLTLDAQIMDWADDISYAVHDIEDFYRVNYIPLEQYTEDSQALADFLEYAQESASVGEASEEALTALKKAIFVFPRTHFRASAEDLASLDEARSTLLTNFINAATVVDDQLEIATIQKEVNSLLKQLIWFHVIDSPRLTNIQTGQRRVLREIFQALLAQVEVTYRLNGATGVASERELRRLPAGLRRSIDVGLRQSDAEGTGIGYSTRAKTVCRGLIDYIASLSDADAYHQHAVLKGREPMGHL